MVSKLFEMVSSMEIPEPIRADLEKIGGIKGLIKKLPKVKKIDDTSKVFQGLSDESRLKIFMIINVHPVCVCVIKNITKMSDSKISYHLSILKECGLIHGKQQGSFIIYHPTKRGKEISGLCEKML